MSCSDSFFQNLSLVGSAQGLVKQLPGFDKKRHTPPKFASDRAQEFLGMVCQSELSEWAEELFAAIRQGMGYRRKELSLSCERRVARFIAKDFTLERRYALLPEEPETYFAETELMQFASRDLLEDAGLNEALGPMFDCLRAVFRSSLDVEQLIDEVEENEESPLSVDYPGDCRYCDIRLEGSAAAFRFDSAALEIRFSSYRNPGGLLQSFDEIAEAMAGVSEFEKAMQLVARR